MRADRVLARACVLAALALAGCGDDAAEPGAGAPAAPPAETAAPEQTAPPAGTGAPSQGQGTTSPAINSVTVDPGDGTIMIGSGPALYRAAPGESKAERLTGTIEGGTVSGNLVVRFAGPNDLLASGHPKGGNLPENLGLIRSKDHGESWTAVEGTEEADYHELEVVGEQIIAVEAEAPDVRVSRDGGRSWETRTPPDAPIDVVVNPGDERHWAVSTEQGTFVSTDAGRSWRPRDTSFGARLVWTGPDALYSIDRNGRVRVSPDGGRTWRERGDVGGLPSEVARGRRNEILVAVVGGKVRRSRDGAKTWSTVATVR